MADKYFQEIKDEALQALGRLAQTASSMKFAGLPNERIELRLSLGQSVELFYAVVFGLWWKSGPQVFQSESEEPPMKNNNWT